MHDDPTPDARPVDVAPTSDLRPVDVAPDPGLADVAPDGSPVDVYRLLPAAGEPDLIHAAVAAGATVLELGCGAGRVTAGLLELGHAVSGVDESAAMLEAAAARAPAARLIRSRIDQLDLGETFDAVVLGSHLVNDEPISRASHLAAARRHLTVGGVLLAEAYSPATDWIAAAGRTSLAGDVRITITRAAIGGTHLSASVRYETPSGAWDQPFVADLLDEAALRATLGEAGFAFDRWIDESRGWLAAIRT